MKKYFVLLAILLSSAVSSWVTAEANNFVQKVNPSKISVTRDMVFMENDFIERAFQMKEGFSTRSFVSRVAKKEYSSAESEEFQLKINGKQYNGKSFRYKTAIVSEIPNGKKLEVELQGKAEIERINITLRYWLYDSSPTVRKQLILKNNKKNEIVLTDLNIESLHLVPADIYMTNVYANYGTNITRTPYVGDYYDPAILLYNEIHKEGIILGNEAPGILKRTDCYSRDFHVNIGMKKETDDYPFKKYLSAGEVFESPKTFVTFSKREKWQDCFEYDLADFIRRHMGVKLFQRDNYPLFYYCTWIPFQTTINENLVKSLADNLADTGVEVLLIDDGWQDNWGDYNSHSERFPNGIEQTCKYIKSKGLKPGMWFSIASINRDSKIYQQHPEWAVTDKNGNPGNVYCLDTFRVTMSMSSPWYDYIHERLRHYIRSCELAYVKLDFAVATSAYITSKEISGDYSAKDGKYGYKDQASSYWSLYQSSIRLFNELKKEFPELIVDCTFEVWGKYHIIDYALIQHADVDWMTNYEFPAPRGPISIRQIAAERSKVIPVQTMMIGNQLIDSPMYQFTYQSLASSVQLMCGDPRDLTTDQKQWYKKWSNWFRSMDNKYQYSRFRYMSDIFEKPSLANWDGCYRFNSDKQGGVLFFYRNGSLNNQMVFPVDVVEPGNSYHIYEPCGGKDWGIISGSDLIHHGLKVRIENQHEALVLGIEKVDNN